MEKIVCTIILLFLFLYACSQKNTIKHPSTLGVHFTLHDFKNSAPSGMKNTDAGLSITYLKGFNNHFDWQLGLNGSFPDSTSKNIIANRKKYLLLQTEFSVRARPFKVARPFQPYFLAGIGPSLYKENLGSYSLFGPGIEINYKDVYFILNAQYRKSLSNNLNNHYYYSIGIAGMLSRPKKQKPFAMTPLMRQPVARDKDGDGIIDSLDVCPNQAGLARFNGCPDSDNDGIPDKEDDCPAVFGYQKYNGCPVPDSDGDGINDEEDQCLEVPGIFKYHGCPVPDSDGDGVNDEDDQCLDTPGVMERKGCPLITKGTSQKIKVAANNILFKNGSYELLKSSFVSLDEVISVLDQDKTLMLTIEGHTDNVGKSDANQLLSVNRAQAVANYLIGKGIEKTRLTAIGFGMQRPITGNNTIEGRAKNRRVELKLY